jgi:hypothetical protein
LKKIFERACFKGLDEKRKKKTMALWLDWIQQSPQDLHIGGVKFGGLYQSGGVAGFPNYFDFEKYEATTKNKKGEDDWIEEMTRRITKETRGDEADVWDDRVPELAFLPIALCMSSGCVIRDRIDYWRSFFLCVSSTDKTKTTFLDIDER